jgi:ATP-binding cassette subfamily B protein
VAGADVRLQTSLYDCGPSALGELLALSGRRVPSAETLRQLAATTPQGTTLSGLAAAATASGLRVTQVEWSPADLGLLPLPSIIWVERSHFVVLARSHSPDSMEVHDPAAGLYRMAIENVRHIWSGRGLVLRDSLRLPTAGVISTQSRTPSSRGARASNS